MHTYIRSAHRSPQHKPELPTTTPNSIQDPNVTLSNGKNQTQTPANGSNTHVGDDCTRMAGFDHTFDHAFHADTHTQSHMRRARNGAQKEAEEADQSSLGSYLQDAPADHLSLDAFKEMSQNLGGSFSSKNGAVQGSSCRLEEASPTRADWLLNSADGGDESAASSSSSSSSSSSRRHHTSKERKLAAANPENRAGNTAGNSEIRTLSPRDSGIPKPSDPCAVRRWHSPRDQERAGTCMQRRVSALRRANSPGRGEGSRESLQTSVTALSDGKKKYTLAFDVSLIFN